MKGLAPSARAIVMSATQVSLAMGHREIDTGHLLLALMRADGPISSAFEARGIYVDDVRREIVRLRGRGGSTAHGHVPFTVDMKQVLRDAESVADARGDPQAGPASLLIALVRLPGSEALTVLSALGENEQTLQLLSLQGVEDAD